MIFGSNGTIAWVYLGVLCGALLFMAYNRYQYYKDYKARKRKNEFQDLKDLFIMATKKPKPTYHPKTHFGGYMPISSLDKSNPPGAE